MSRRAHCAITAISTGSLRVTLWEMGSQQLYIIKCWSQQLADCLISIPRACQTHHCLAYHLRVTLMLLFGLHLYFLKWQCKPAQHFGSVPVDTLGKSGSTFRILTKSFDAKGRNRWLEPSNCFHPTYFHGDSEG